MSPELEMLQTAKTIAVVGLSSNPARSSHGVSAYMQSVGYRIIPVNPHESEVLGEKAYARLEDIPEKVDLVDVFRRAEYTPDVVDSAARIGAKGVWLQQGIVSDEARKRAAAHGLLYTEDYCIYVAHKTLMPRE